MSEMDYEPGSLSELIAAKSRSKKGKVKKAVSRSNEENLQRIFEDSSSGDYVTKPLSTEIEDTTRPTSSDKLTKIQEEADDAIQPNTTVERRKEVREKSKLVKLRQREKLATGSHTVFVGNVPVEAEKKDIRKFFKKYGTIKSIRFRSLMRKDITKPLKASAIKRDLHPLCKALNVYIVFEEERSASRALKRNGKEFLGSHLRVDLASSSVDKEPNRKCSVFVGNVPFDAHEEALRKHFSGCGDIVNVRLIRDKETRLGKGFGYVEFKTADGVALALQMHDHAFGKNKLRVQRCLRQTNSSQVVGKEKSWSGAFASRHKSTKVKKTSVKQKTKARVARGNKPSRRGKVKAKAKRKAK
ncbi:RNA-binding protein 34-like [Watersipora subatra]|uniref:RNA-binding protein 34-like n=1 Tax=Watersipora subatra TaxID=2589382 RepID=UPI00355BC417